MLKSEYIKIKTPLPNTVSNCKINVAVEKLTMQF